MPARSRISIKRCLHFVKFTLHVVQLPVVVARSFSVDNAIRCVLIVLWITLYLHKSLMSSGGSTLGLGGHRPPNLGYPPNLAPPQKKCR